MRVAFVLPGLHKVTRGAEVAFEAIAHELSQFEDTEVTLIGSGKPIETSAYDFQHVSSTPREKFESWPKFPVFREVYVYEELSFVRHLPKVYQPDHFDVTVTCSYPFINWFLRWQGGRKRPPHVFVTQNSDHPAIASQSEYRFFSCEGLVCTNFEYFERNKATWNCALITNGVNPERFYPQEVDRTQFGLPKDAPVALMVCALMPSKRAIEGIKAAAQIPDLHLVLCGDGPERDTVRQLGEQLMGDRFHPKKLPFEQMPDIYRAADMFMHFSLDEPFGNVYLEALATGLPIVAHDREVTRWIVEDNAVLVDSTSTEAIAAGIQKALALKDADSVAARLALIEKRFTWKAIGQQYYDFLHKVVQ
ncbi:glycosyltransferase family 4 protein [Oscillatoria sp. CS-180]|uniref:glycosyltransferase family 4 protein n=1 Tax=Oscillatoria sp. CS-180 TaxID=3021720 RepID=UPI00232AF185|nr:glycosyltransferase family 4 protein [Oscillatoria sp. CS-180]MDB9525574.1 glycosyltransferase family 4 protein [Oscillatoria sp. CS-180]